MSKEIGTTLKGSAHANSHKGMDRADLGQGYHDAQPEREDIGWQDEFGLDAHRSGGFLSRPHWKGDIKRN
jgi:hypothetical protein